MLANACGDNLLMSTRPLLTSSTGTNLSPYHLTAMLNTSGGTHEEEEEAKRRREQLERRPSYKKILQDLSTVERDVKVQKLDPALSNSHLTVPNAMPAPNGAMNTSPIPAITTSNMKPQQQQQQVYNNLRPPSVSQSQQPSMTNLMSSTAAALSPLTSKHQMLQQTHMLPFAPIAVLPPGYGMHDMNNSGLGPSPNHQSLLMPIINNDIRGLLPIGDPTATSSHTPTYSSRTMSESPSPVPSSSGKDSVSGNDNTNSGGPPTAKRQQRLEKNREAAKECRRKKKEYVRCLESRVSILEQQNKQLILELKSLKDVYCRKEKTEQ